MALDAFTRLAGPSHRYRLKVIHGQLQHGADLTPRHHLALAQAWTAAEDNPRGHLTAWAIAFYLEVDEIGVTLQEAAGQAAYPVAGDEGGQVDVTASPGF